MYVYGGSRDDVWVERRKDSTGLIELNGSTQLVFGRTFEGWSGSEGTYFEVNQDYTHTIGIHWHPDQRAYCRFDDNSDIEQVASVTARSDHAKDVLCVSFTWAPMQWTYRGSRSSEASRLG